MYLSFLGCRGSTPVSAAQYAGYGGSTSCIALWRDDDADGAPHLVLDAGTGFVNLEHVLGDTPFEGTVLVTHLHWDHTHGLPFLRNAGTPGHRLHLVVPAQGADPEAVMNRAFSPPHFPVEIGLLGANWSFSGIEPGAYEYEGFEVRAEEIPHKGSRTFGYRICHGGVSVAYLPDHMPLDAGPGPDGLGAYHRAALALADGVDVLVHDAQHTASELPDKAFLGHSAAEYVVGLGVAARARAVVLFHHDPHRSDAQIDEIARTLSHHAPLPVLAAREGMVLCPEPLRVQDTRWRPSRTTVAGGGTRGSG